MKGVILQVGEPNSIVLLNNGKITSIPSPANCRVGMIVTVKINNLLRIIIVSIAAVLLIALGVFIGATFFKGKPAAPPETRGYGDGHGHGHMMEHGR